MKNHKGILYDGFVLLSRIECKKNCNLFFSNFKIYVAMQSGCYGDFAPILECRTLVKCGLTRELSMMINLHLT